MWYPVAPLGFKPVLKFGDQTTIKLCFEHE
jgi:hypothetical protein